MKKLNNKRGQYSHGGGNMWKDQKDESLWRNTHSMSMIDLDKNEQSELNINVNYHLENEEIFKQESSKDDHIYTIKKSLVEKELEKLNRQQQINQFNKDLKTFNLVKSPSKQMPIIQEIDYDSNIGRIKTQDTYDTNDNQLSIADVLKQRKKLIQQNNLLKKQLNSSRLKKNVNPILNPDTHSSVITISTNSNKVFDVKPLSLLTSSRFKQNNATANVPQKIQLHQIPSQFQLKNQINEKPFIRDASVLSNQKDSLPSFRSQKQKEQQEKKDPSKANQITNANNSNVTLTYNEAEDFILLKDNGNSETYNFFLKNDNIPLKTKKQIQSHIENDV
ncbi:UNKNOWN [Stylonychia lemnae]|uniref:Uncharacterized protein n=1 Tax=Stylonychia lemnae TaxID=5949 RepID=A0A078A580_STYLE|nr:UNKNOWN [Stylonychia lemnae]|eukprot:CDW77380.1 UNKNOWN [Stylonychia lemnae]